MFGQHYRWTISIATGTSLLGLTITSGLAMLASYFIDQFSRPHIEVDNSDLEFILPGSAQDPPLSYQHSLLFQARDGTLLCGDFWAQPQPAPTVILCHGYRISRAHMRCVAALEYSQGYNVLFFDFRGHGDSDSVMTSGGNIEVRDLEAAIEVAVRQPETLPGKIILHGFSMGAAIALLTPPNPHVVAIVADSPYARSDDVIRRIICFQLSQVSENLHPFLRQLLHWLVPTIVPMTIVVGTILFRMRYGFSMVARPDTTFKRWKARARKVIQQQQRSIPILLIHAEGDELIPIAHARQIVAQAKANNVPLETFFVESPYHCGAYGYNPDQYTGVLLEFLTRHLGDDFPVKRYDVA